MGVRVALLLLFYVVSVKCYSSRTDNNYWLGLANEELVEALKVKWNEGAAKNVILFIGDGMGPNTVTAARIYKGGEGHRLEYEKFPHMGLLKTYSADYMVTDSASTATAMFSGVKVNRRTVGVDTTVKEGDCEASLRPEARLPSLVSLAQSAGKSTGFVTTMRVSHATPAPLYAHMPGRWECEARVPDNATACKDIARQLIEDKPGQDINVIMGGGRQVLVSNSTGSPADPIDTWSCISQDGRDLIRDYIEDKQNRSLKYSYVRNNRELDQLNVEETDFLLGIFANGHLKYEHERDQGPDGMPSISNMVEAAIKVLQKNDKGYFLMVEGGNIDMAHHRGRAKTAINEAIAMEEAVKLAAIMTDEKDTLLIVTSDHSHSMTINGYQERGSNIFGVVQGDPAHGTNYTTLTYGTGGPGSFQYHVTDNQSEVARRDPSLDNTDDYYYEQIAAVTAIENLHGGSDVAVYARGPYSHLFHNVHEQHYVYHVIKHAMHNMARSNGNVYFANVFILLFLCLASSVFIVWR